MTTSNNFSQSKEINFSGILPDVNNSFKATSKENRSTEASSYMKYKTEWDAGTVIICIEFALAFFLNAAVIFVILTRKKRTRFLYFILHLAISDFLMASVFVFPVMIDRLLDAWHGGIILCKGIKYLGLTALYASTYILVIMSVDRLYAIIRPLSATRRGHWYKRTCVICAWTVGALLGIPEAINSKMMKYGEKWFCEVRPHPAYMEKVFENMFAVMNVLVPGLIVTFCYTCIVLAVWRRSSSGFFSKSRGSTNSQPSGIQCDVINRAKIRSIKITFVVVSAFFISWTPYTLAANLAHNGVIQFGGYFFILFSLAPLNSVANPIVFFIFNRKKTSEEAPRGNGTSTKTFSFVTRNSMNAKSSVVVSTHDDQTCRNSNNIWM